MTGDPNFAYDVLRPVAVVSGYLISMRLGWMLQDWRVKRAERRASMSRNVTPERLPADMMGRKRHLHGDRHPFARLNEVAVRQIRSDERSAPELAPIYGVGAETIRLVRQRKIWKHVD